MRGRDKEEWPDGLGLAYQPIRLIQAVAVVNKYLDENAPPKEERKR